MRCERCGAPLGNRIIKINGVVYCENCIRELGFEKFLNDPATEIFGGFGIPIDDLAPMMHLRDLDFGNNNLTCPRCKTTLRMLQNNKMVGCIECYNTFSDQILKELLKQQGDAQYKGRQPKVGIDGEIAAIEPRKHETTKREATVEDNSKPAAKQQTKSDEEILRIFERADLGTVSDEELTRGMKIAAKAENYKLAKRLKDEIEGRKGGNGNVV